MIIAAFKVHSVGRHQVHREGAIAQRDLARSGSLADDNHRIEIDLPARLRHLPQHDRAGQVDCYAVLVFHSEDDLAGVAGKHFEVRCHQAISLSLTVTVSCAPSRTVRSNVTSKPTARSSLQSKRTARCNTTSKKICP